MKIFNLYFKTQTDDFNILGLPEDKLTKVVTAYKKGLSDITLNGKKYWIGKLSNFQIFTHEVKIEPSICMQQAINGGEALHSFGRNHYLPIKILERLGKNVTDDYIGDTAFGEEKENASLTVTGTIFVSKERIEELKKIIAPNFDLSRLVRFCEELNDNYTRGNYLSVAMLGRSIINHIPPIFGFNTFNEVANNYGSKSFKGIALHLNTTMRGIADSFLHDTIRKNETLPNSIQINFSQDLDFVLAEVIRKLKTP
jgi:hypothetical protein